MIFVHQPRTGGSSLEYAIFGKPYGKEGQKRHWPASEWRRLEPKRWNAERKITIVRNPYSWTQSLFLTHGRDRGMSFLDWLLDPVIEGGMSLSQKSNTDGCDDFLHTESLSADLSALRGVRPLFALEHRNPCRLPKWELSQNEMSAVYSVCAEDFAEFGYEPI